MAEHYRSGAALKNPRGGDRGRRYYRLVVEGPADLADELLADERYHGDWAGRAYRVPLRHFAPRRGPAAHQGLAELKKEARASDAEQTIERAMLMTGPYSGKQVPFGEPDPVTVSETLAELTRLIG